MWMKGITFIPEQLNPLWMVRFSGPLGPTLVSSTRKKLVEKLAETNIAARSVMASYIYHCNAQNPSGEAAFRALMNTFGWAKNCMVHRLHRLDKDIPTTFIHGSHSWVPRHPEHDIKELRKDSYVNIQVLEGVGHEVFAEEQFNVILLKACAFADQQNTM